MNKRFVHAVQAFGIYLFYYTVSVLPLSCASACGGWVGRMLGPRLGINARARYNIKMVFPEKTDEEVDQIVIGMWDNLGRMAFEFPHLTSMSTDPLPEWLSIVGGENLDALKASGHPGLFFSAHLANWEIFAPIASFYKIPLGFVYRMANNEWMEKLYQRRRKKFSEFIPRGIKGTRRVAEAMREGKSLAMLIDQKMNKGVEVPFLGHPAMTAPGLAHLALRTGYPVIPTRAERLGGCRFRVTFYPPLTLPPEDMDRDQATCLIMEQVNATVGEWIRERPEQWFWLHRRWPDSKYQTKKAP